MRILILFLLSSPFVFKAYSQDFNMTDGQTVNTDVGNFYDPNGSDGPTTTGSFTYTICPDTANLLLVIEFVEFLTGPGTLEIYDGPDDSSDLLFSFSGGIGGNNAPATGQIITASDANASGCLTFVFSGGVPNPAFSGWNALIDVREPCQIFDMTLETDIPLNEVAYGQTVEFNANVIPGSGIYSGLIYTWDFGDGNTAEGQTVEHAFQNTSNNLVVLTVTDQFGCSGSTTVQITPIVRFINVSVNMPFDIDQLDDEGNPETLTINSVDDLVIDVLVDNDCANVSNISFTGNPNVPSIAYFDNDGSGFPIASGIVFNNGDANLIEGPDNGTTSEGEWDNTANSEPELSEFIPTIAGQSNDQSVLTFDFEAVSESLSFDFVFASEEYNGYQCNDSFADAFVFILTDEAGDQQNLALVPGTTDPISVPTISPGTQAGCPPVNAEYFGNEYWNGNGAIAPIEYAGHTVVLTAEATINPGEVYNIKMIIADRGDTAFDSAIFISAGSFDFGTVDLGTDILVENDNAICGGDEITLNTGLELFTGASVEWFKNDVLIPDENQVNLDVDDEGIYKVVYTYSTGCSTEDIIEVEFLPTPLFENINPQDLFACEGGAFNLELNNENLVANTDNLNNFQILYFNSLEDAENDLNSIDDPDAYSFDGVTETIYFKITGIANNQPTDCFEIGSFDITYQDVEINQSLTRLTLCSDYSSSQLPFDLTQVETQALSGQNPDDFNFSYYLSQNDADTSSNSITDQGEDIEAYEATSGEEIFIRADNIQTVSCFDVGSFILEINNVRIGDLNTAPIIQSCQDPATQTANFDLTQNQALAFDGQSPPDFDIYYYTSAADANLNLTENTIENPENYEVSTLTGQIEIYVVILNTNTDDCFVVSNFIIESFETPIIENLEDYEACGDYTLSQTFNLSTNAQSAIGDQIGTYNTSFYLTEAEAESGVNSLTDQGEDITNYSPLNAEQSLFIRLENASNSSCYSVDSFDIIINNTRIADLTQELVLESCQDPNTLITSFNLTSYQNIALDGQTLTDYEVYFYDDQTDALANNTPNAIPDISNYTTPNLGQQIIYVSVENQSNTNCFVVSNFTIEAFETPVISTLIDFEKCGDFTFSQIFDITQNTLEALGTQNPDFEVSYYSTEPDAQSAVNSFTDQGLDTSNFSINSNSETVFVRIENPNNTNCYSVDSFDIQLFNVEVANTINLENCIDPLTGVANFDLTDNQSEILGANQDANDYSIAYFKADGNQITEVESYGITDSEIITVEISNNASPTCTQTATFEVNVTEQPQVSPATVLEVCIDYAQTGVVNAVDLTQKDSEINALGMGDTVAYYLSLTAFENENPITTPNNFDLQESQTELYAAVVNTVSGCRSEVTSFDVENVFPLVDISSFTGRSVCIDLNGDLVFTETSPPVIDTELSETDYDFEWSLDGEVISGETSSRLTAIEPGIYTVEVFNALSLINCSNTSSAEIIESGQINFELAIITESFQNNEHGIGVTITELGLGDYEFRIDYGEWFDLEEGRTSLIFSNVPGGVHTITARDKNGCGEVSRQITLIDYPEFFTPNADGYNDLWQLDNSTVSNLSVNEINIFDRYGKHIYQLSPQSSGWNGTYKGEVLPADDYWFTIEYIEPLTGEQTLFKSHFTLKR